MAEESWVEWASQLEDVNLLEAVQHFADRNGEAVAIASCNGH